jgi:6-phosphogluconolactonase
MITSARDVRTSSSTWRMLMLPFAGLALLMLPSCGGGGSSSSSSSHLAYVAGGQTNVVGLRIKSSGEFQTLLGSPFVAGNGPSSILVHPSNKFLFVSNQTEGTISLFTINPNSGALTEVLPRTPVGVSPVAMAMDSGGTVLFVANQGSHDISVFSIGSNGALSAAGFPTSVGSSPSGITLSSTGFLYVPVPNFSAIYVFVVSSGTLTQVGSPFFVSDGLATLAVDPAAKSLFVPNPSTGTVTVLTIQPDGSLAAGPGAFAASTSPVAATTDLTGKYLYVANFGSTTISQYTIDSTTGALTAFSTGTPTVGTNPTFILPDPNGKFIYVGNQGSSSLTEFIIKSDGSLASTSNSITLGVQPRSLSVTK